MLEHVAARTQLDDRTALAYARAIEGMTSSYDKRQALVALIARDPLPAAAKQSVLTSAASVRSDYDRREILVAYLRQQGVDAATRQPFLDAANRIRSTQDQNRVLAELVKAERR